MILAIDIGNTNSSQFILTFYPNLAMSKLPTGQFPVIMSKEKIVTVHPLLSEKQAPRRTVRAAQTVTKD